MEHSRLKVKGLEVWVQIDERELACYNVVADDLDPTDVSCWIASEAGKARILLVYVMYRQTKLTDLTFSELCGEDRTEKRDTILNASHYIL